MKKLLMMVASCLSLQCTAQSAPPAVEDLGNYIAANAPLAESGKLLWSEFYKQVFAKLVALNASGDMLERENKLIRYAELYESGKIDKSDFEYRRRMLQAEAASADQAARSAEQAQRALDQQIAEQQAEQP